MVDLSGQGIRGVRGAWNALKLSLRHVRRISLGTSVPTPLTGNTVVCPTPYAA